MNKMIVLFSGTFLVLFIFVSLIVFNDNKNISNLEKKILDNTDVTLVKYINYYDEHYIVKDNDNLYLFNGEYEQILSINLSLLFSKYNNYDIVYRNKTLMFMNEYKGKEGIIFKYYDIYTGECIDEILVGGFDE